jgi:hypothetical protein
MAEHCKKYQICMQDKLHVGQYSHFPRSKCHITKKRKAALTQNPHDYDKNLNSSLASSTCCNPKHKNDLDDAIIDTISPNPLEVEAHVPSHVCNWSQTIVCNYPELAPQNCQHVDCKRLVHHLCQAAWEQQEGHPATIACYCCQHHPQYKYQISLEMSRLTKKSLSSTSGRKTSVDTNATVGEKENDHIESVLDGDKELLRDELTSAAKSTKETTVSHLNQSRQNIVVDGKLYVTKSGLLVKKIKWFTLSICSVEWLWINLMGQCGSHTMKS